MSVFGAGCRAIVLLLATAAVAHPWGDVRELRFEANRGQVDEDASFLARGPGFLLLLEPSEAVLRLDGSVRCGATPPGLDGLQPVVRMRFAGARPGGRLVAEEPLRGHTNYFRGSDPSQWIAGVRNYGRVVSQDIYAGIDLVYYSRENTLAFDLRVSPGADASAAEIVFEGAQAVELDANGELEVRLEGRSLRVGRPLVYQEEVGGRDRIPSEYVIKGGNRVGFRIGDYDRSRLLTIDPVLSYCTYLGGTGDDIGRAVAVDEEGFVYVTGSTDTLGLPQAPPGQGDAFVVKLDPRRSEVVYATYLGGGASDTARGVAVDANGSVYVVGETYSTDFPLANPYQSSLRGLADAFIAKLDPAGETLEFATYFGGSAFESARGVAIDSQGQVAFMGQTVSPDLPTSNAVQSSFGGAVDAFVAKLDASGSGLVFSTFLGGSGHDLPFHKPGCGEAGDAPGWDLAVDGDGEIYVAGTTESLDFPVANALQPNHGQGLRDGFVSKFSPDGSTLVYSTFLGGSGGDSARGIAVDGFGRASVTGATRSADFPITVDAIQSQNHGVYDAFLVVVDPTGSSLLYSTYFGGAESDAGNAVALDALGRAVVVGQTLSSDYPVLDAFQSSYHGGLDTFVTHFDPNGSLFHSSYLGGALLETPCGVNMGVAVDGVGTAFVAGSTESIDFPVTADAVQPVLGGGFDAFLAEVRVAPEIVVALTPEGGSNRLTVTLLSHGSAESLKEVKLWIELDDESKFSFLPVPYSLTPPAGKATIMFNVLLPGSLSFPGMTIGARLVEAESGLTISESLCSESPCH